MSILIAIVVLSSVMTDGTTSAAQPLQPASIAADAETSASIGGARTWLALLDDARWEGSWRAAADLFRSQITAPQWASTIEQVRRPLGRTSSRTLLAVEKSRSLPGLPAGDYEVLQFQTDLTNRNAVLETVTFARAPAGGRVIGYYVRQSRGASAPYGCLPVRASSRNERHMLRTRCAIRLIADQGTLAVSPSTFIAMAVIASVMLAPSMRN